MTERVIITHCRKMLNIKVTKSVQFEERTAQVGDCFYEVGYPEVWQVTESAVTVENMHGCQARVVSYRTPKDDACWPIGHTSFWGYANNWHAANLVLLKVASV